MKIGKEGNFPSFTGIPRDIYESSSYNRERNLIINELFKSCFAELATVAAFTGIAYSFVVPESTTFLRMFSITSVVTNVLLRTSASSLEYLSLRIDDNSSQNAEKKRALKNIIDTFKWVIPVNFALLFNATAGVLIHEGGHALAVSMLYSNAQPQIVIKYLFEGNTTFFNRGFSALGRSLGASNVSYIVCAAGPLTAIFMATLAVLLAIRIGKSHTTASKYLYCSSLFSLGYHVKYALSALAASRSDQEHDFVKLWQAGIHPVLAAGAMIAVPIVASALYVKLKNSIDNPFESN